MIRSNGSALVKVIVALAVAALIVTTSASDADAAKRRSGARADEPSVFVKVAVLLINFTNQPSVPWAKEDVNQLFFGGGRSVASYYDEVSEGQMSVTGQVFGYLKAGRRYDGYCEYTTWGRRARDAAAASGINLSQFTNVVYVFPYQPACKWNGFSQAGPNRGPGRNSWVNGLLTVFVAAHELGHNFGLGHAASIRCNLDGVRVTIGGTCSTYAYGDPFDVMGYGATVRHVQAWHRWRLGFLQAAEVLTVTQTGTYRISAAEFGGEHPRLLRIDRGNGTWFYLEFRQPFGQFDDFADGAAVVNGVSIRIAAVGMYRDTRLLDATPETCTFLDSSLALGETFRDASGQLRITTLDINSTSAQVEVRIGGSDVAPVTGEGDPTEEPDTEAPGPVSNVAVQQVTGNTVAVSWAKASDNVGVAKYEVYTDNVFRGTTCDVRFRNIPMSGGRPHSVSVRAVDRAGNFGPFETISYTPPDFTSPGGMGRRIYTSVSGGKVTVSWRAATDNVGVAFYRVIKNGRILADVGALVRSYRDDSPGTGYLRYSVTAFDAAGNASRPLVRKIYR